MIFRLTGLLLAGTLMCSGQDTASDLSPQTLVSANSQQSQSPLASLNEEKNATHYKSIFRIEVASQNPDYKTPWNSGRFSGGSGTGFLIGKNRFLTNAHVVSNQKRVIITMRGSSRKHTARVVHVAHDCDLALLEVEDYTPFKDLSFLPIGEVPQLESEVRVIGYPVGGDRISVTRGVVSRIDFRSYAHSRIDSHLVIQIDAAINPGNSGGPVLQDGKVVGVAFQGLRSADNTGYMIPTPVVRRFLQDIEDGRYDHYVDLGVAEFPLHNPAMRAIHNLAPDAPGVLVGAVTAGDACDGVLEPGDILTSIDGHQIDSEGNVVISGERVKMHEIVERKFAGDTVELKFLRQGSPREATITLQAFPPARVYAVKYDQKPRYSIQAGFVFQPLDRNLYASHRLNNPRVRRIFNNYLEENLHETRKDIVILTRVLDDPINAQLDAFAGNAVTSVNGVDVVDLNHLHEMLHPETLPEFFEVRFDGIQRPLILQTSQLKTANERIAKNYSVPSPFYLEK